MESAGTTGLAGYWNRLLDTALSLQSKATVLVVALVLGVTAIVSGYFLRSTAQLARAQQNEVLTQLASMLSRTTATSVAQRDSEALQALADDVADGHALAYIAFFDDQGVRLAGAQSHGRDALAGAGLRHLEDGLVPGTPVYRAAIGGVSGFLDIKYPINVRTDQKDAEEAGETVLVGYLCAGMAADAWRQWMANRTDLLVGVSILAAAVAIPLGFLLIRRIVSPLEGLGVAMQRFSQGRLDVRNPVGRRDEIGRLADAFNRMADQHQQSHERIVRLNADLEDRVARRTRQLRELAARDPLTGLYNRRHFNEVIARSFSEVRRYDVDLSCIMIDLDDFKAVNDAFGHHVGDELLVMTAATITSQLRASDIPARFGGDEFIVLLPQTDVERAEVLGGRIVESFAEAVRASLPHVDAGLSLGIASVHSVEATDPESLIRAVDRALYEAKAAGKNCMVAARSEACSVLV